MRISLDYLGEHRWRVRRPLTYMSRYGLVLVPAGFETDLASVPRLPLVYWTTGDRTITAAVIHDRLYAVAKIAGNRITRAMADKVMLDAMKKEGVPRRQRWAIYLGVRVGGWIAWRRHRSNER